MSIERALFDLLPLANPAQDPDNTLKIPDFESGGPFKTTIWQKGTYSSFDDSATISGIKVGGRYYAFGTPVSIGNTFSTALMDAVKDVFSANEELGGVVTKLIIGPFRATTTIIVSGLPFDAFMTDANNEFTGYFRSGVPDYYTVVVQKATPENAVTFLIQSGAADTNSGKIHGLYCGIHSGNLANAPYEYSGTQATDEATASTLKTDLQTFLNDAVNNDTYFTTDYKPEEAPTVEYVKVNDDINGFDIGITFPNSSHALLYDSNGSVNLSTIDSMFTPIANGKQINTTQVIV